MRYYFYYLSTLMKKAGVAQIMKGLDEFDDAQLTVDWAIEHIVIAGSPATVAEKLLAVREQVGPFGTMVLTGLDWDDKALWKRSMALMAEEVMPRLRQATTRGDRRQVALRSYDNRHREAKSLNGLERELVVAITLVMLVSARAVGAQDDFELAMVIKSTTNPYYNATLAGAQMAAEELGGTVENYGPTQSSATAQVDIINNLADRRIPAIAVAPSDPDAVAPAMKRAQQHWLQGHHLRRRIRRVTRVPSS